MTVWLVATAAALITLHALLKPRALRRRFRQRFIEPIDGFLRDR